MADPSDDDEAQDAQDDREAGDTGATGAGAIDTSSSGNPGSPQGGNNANAEAETDGGDDGTTGSAASGGQNQGGYQPGRLPHNLPPPGQRNQLKPVPTPVQDAPLISLKSDTPTADDSAVTWADYGKVAWNRVQGMGADALGAASLLTNQLGADPNTVLEIEKMRAGVVKNVQDTIESMSPGMQKALHSSMFGGVDANGDHIPTPGEVGYGRFFAASAAGFVPDVALSYLSSAIAGPLSIGIMGAFYGVTQAGNAYEDLVGDIDKSKPEDWKDSKAMQAALESGTSFEDAKRLMLDHSALQIGAVNFVIGAATGAGTLGLLLKGPLGSAGYGAMKRIGLGVAEGSATMGFQSGGQELGQEAVETGMGLTNGFDTGKLATAFASGALAGAIPGGVGGLMHGNAKPADLNPKQEETALPGKSANVQVPEDVQMALDLTVAAPGISAGQSQGELFRSPADANLNGNRDRAPAGPAAPAATATPPQMPTQQGALDLGGGGPSPATRPGYVDGDPQSTLFAPNKDKSQPLMSEPGQSAPAAPPPKGQTEAPLVAAPGTNPGETQGSLFRTADEANASSGQPSVGTVSGGAGGGRAKPDQTSVATPAGSPGASPGVGRAPLPAPADNPAAGLTRKQLVEAVTTMPGQDPKTVARLKVSDLQTIYNRETQRAKTPPAPGTKAEPQADIDAQAAAVGDKDHPKDSMFVADGSPMPTKMPEGAKTVEVKGGKFITTNDAKAQAAPGADYNSMGRLLGYTETKDHAEADRNVQAVQAKDAKGNIIHEQLTSQEGKPAAVARAAEMTPAGGTTEVAPHPMMRGDESLTETRKKLAAFGDESKVRWAKTIADSGATLEKMKGTAARFKEWLKTASPEEVRAALKDKAENAPSPLARALMRKMLAKFDEGHPAEETKGETEKTATPAVTEAPAAAPLTDAQRARALRKASMAAPGERVRGRVETVEAPEGSKTAPLADDREPLSKSEALAKVEDAVRQYKVVPLKTGDTDGVNKAIQRMVRELSHVTKDAKTSDDVAEEVAKWGAKNRGLVGATKVRGIDVADHIVQLLTGKKLSEFAPPSGMGYEARQDSAHAPQAFEKETSRGLGHDDEGEGATVAHDLDMIKLAPKATPKPQKLSDQVPWLFRRVLTDEMSIHDAADQIAPKLPGSPGRTRHVENESLAHYIDSRIAVAEDPAKQKELKDRLETIQTEKTTPQAKKAEGDRINALMETTGPKWAAKLRALREELDPVHDLAEKTESPPIEKLTGEEKRAPIINQIKARNAEKMAAKGIKTPGPKDRVSTMLEDPRTNKVVHDMLSDGKTHNMTDYLHAISGDAAVVQHAPEMAALARQMLKYMHDNVMVDAHAPSDVAGRFTPSPEPGTGQISINEAGAISSVETVLHEGMHAITAHYIESLPADHPDRQLLRAISNEMSRTLKNVVGHLTPGEVDEATYALSDPHELHTMLMTNPVVQRLAAISYPSFGFQGKMRSLGYVFSGVKNMWAAFTQLVRKAVGLKGAATSGSGSLLDHVMKPLQDITERAAEFNRNPPVDMSFSPTGAARETPLEQMSHAMPDFSKKGISDMWTNHVDPAGLNDKLRQFWLQSSPLDHMVKWNKELMTGEDGVNTLAKYRDASEAVAARSKEYRDAYDDKVKDLNNRMTNADDLPALAKLMNDATIANVQLGNGADNTHLGKSGPSTVAPLQSRFKALSPKDAGLYEDVRDHYAKAYGEEQEARIRGLMQGAVPDATANQVNALVKASKSMKALDALTDRGTGDNELTKMGFKDEDQRGLVKQLMGLQKKGFVQGDYFHLGRFGDYVVRYGSDEGGDRGVEMFERRAQAEARREELRQSGTENLSQVMDKQESSLHNIAPSALADEIRDTMIKRGASVEEANAMHETVSGVILQHATRSEAARAAYRRKGVAGASLEVNKTLAQDHLARASRIGNLENGAERMQSVQEMRRQADWLDRNGKQGEGIRARQIVKEVEQRIGGTDDQSGVISGFARRVSNLGFAQSLMSFSHIFTATMEAHTNSAAILGARHGYGATSLALARALRDASPVLVRGGKNALASLSGKLKSTDWSLAKVVRDTMIDRGADSKSMHDLFDRLIKSGIVDHTATIEMKRIANPSAMDTGGVWGKFRDFNASMAHAADVTNKSAIAKAAYDLELKKTGSHTAALDYAMDKARQAMPNYNYGNKARIASAQGWLGAYSGPLTQFKQYGINMYAMMATLAKEAIHNEEGNRAEAAKAFTGILVTHAMMAGTMTWIADPLRYIGGLYDWITGAKKPHDYQTNVRGWMSDILGPKVGEIVARGLPHAVGIDVSHRVGLANLLEVPEMSEFSKKGFMEVLGSAMTGAGAEDAANMADGVGKFLHGDIMGGLKGVMPRMLADVAKAGDLASRGVVTGAGKTVLPANKASWFDVGARAVGFQPSRVSEAREGRAAVNEARDEAKEEHSQLTDQWVNAKQRGNVLPAIADFNKRNPGQRITMSTLRQALSERAKTAQSETRDPGSFGLKLPAKAATTLERAGRFANTQ